MTETNNRGCLKEKDLGDIRSDIRLLRYDSERVDLRLRELADQCESTTELNTAISVMTLTLDHIVEHNERQDKLQEKQSDTLDRINDNLNVLNGGQVTLNRKVESLEHRVTENEQKTSIDLRDINKQDTITLLKKYGAPFALGGGITLIILEIVKAIFS